MIVQMQTIYIQHVTVETTPLLTLDMINSLSTRYLLHILLRNETNN